MSDHAFFYKTYSHSASELSKKLWFYVHSVGWFGCRPDYDVIRESFFDFQLKYVVKGRGTVFWQGRSYTVEPGQIFFLDLNQAHRYSADQTDPWELRWVHFGGPQAAGFFNLLQADGCPVYQVHDPKRAEKWFVDLYELFGQRLVGLEARASSIITEILTDMVVMRMEGGEGHPSLSQPQYPEAIRRAIVYMERHFSEPLKMEQVAAQALLSPFHFSRLFKSTTGYTVMEYLLKFRLTQAKYLLVQTMLPVGEIAEKVGFCDASYFGKLFKKYEKITPKEYRHTRSEIASLATFS